MSAMQHETTLKHLDNFLETSFNKHKFVQKVAKRIIILIYFIFSANINFVQ